MHLFRPFRDRRPYYGGSRPRTPERSLEISVLLAVTILIVGFGLEWLTGFNPLGAVIAAVWVLARPLYRALMRSGW